MNQVFHYFANLFSAEGFPPRWNCGFWTPFHGWLYIIADIGIWPAYFTIPLVLLYFVRKRADLPFAKLFWLFAMFIFACGTSHLVDAMMFWWPNYRLLGLVDVFTAIISWVTVITLLPIIPKALALKSPIQLEQVVQDRTQALERAKADIEAAEERYRLVVEGSQDGIWDWDLVQNELFWNDQLYQMLGIEKQESPLTFNDFELLLHPDDQKRVQELIQAHCNDSNVKFETEYRLRHSSGTYRFCLARGKAQRDSQGKPTRMAGLLTDITDRRKTEEALKESQRTLANYAQKLEQSNRELEQFAVVTSHDLQEPLRKVQIFGDLLKQSADGKLDPDCLDYIDRMQQSTNRMQHLIIDLLDLSRVNRQGKPFKTTNLTSVVQDVIHDLSALTQEVSGEIQVGDMITLEADATQLHQLLQNLISNSLKFHRDESPPVVKVSSRYLSDDVGEITIEDNGIGFEGKYKERIFQIFERLHGRQYEGTGVGLAICKRIVERHGGNIEAEGIPGEGARFIIHLPIKQFSGTNWEAPATA